MMHNVIHFVTHSKMLLMIFIDIIACCLSLQWCMVEPCSVSYQFIGYDAPVHLQISTDYLRERCMTTLEVTYR